MDTSRPTSPEQRLENRWTQSDLAEIERRTQAIGRYIFDHLDQHSLNVFQRRWWDERLMRWAMSDEALKVQLFRFVDVLPMLESSDAVITHLNEYLEQVSDSLPASFRVALGVARRTPFTRHAVARAARLSAMDLARRFIAGTNVHEVLQIAQRERERKRAFTLDILGEAVISDVEAERYFNAYVSLVEQISPIVNSWPEVRQIDRSPTRILPRMNLSIKLSALDSQFDAIDPEGALRRAGNRFRALLRTARHHRAFVNVDMESYATKDLTLFIFQQVLMEDEFRDIEDVGIVLQAYLRDSFDDAGALSDWVRERGCPVWVRLVKGAYWDYEVVHATTLGWPVPVYEQKWETDANFERMTRLLLSDENLRTAIGSHNIRSIAHALAVGEQLKLPKRSFELQMLHGMADAEKQTLVEAGHRLRLYMPYGELIPGMAYLVRRLLENTSDDSFLRAGFVDQVDPLELLKSPLESDSTTASIDRRSSVSTKHPRRRSEEADQVLDRTMDHRMSRVRTGFSNEPPVDFARVENRQLMQDGLERVRGKLGRNYSIIINGQEAESSEQAVSEDPGQTDRVIGRIGQGTREHVEQAVAAARRALPQWRALSAQERASYLLRAADTMSACKFELAAWEVYECAKGWREATNDVAEAIDFCRFYAAVALDMAQRHGVDVPGEENSFTYTSRGVAAVIAPWNFPLAILAGMTVAALVTGNTVVMKPAEQSPVMGALLMDIFQQVGLPAGVLNYLPGRGEIVGAGLVEHPDVALVAFTGSREVGLEIYRRAAEVSATNIGMVKFVIAEMGGKNAIIVDTDADLDEAVAGVVASAFGYQGQKCSACSRAIVLEQVYDVFLDRLVEASRSLKVGHAEHPATIVGPVIDSEARDRIERYIEIGRQEGREVLAVEVDASLKQNGHYIGPHVIADVQPNARLAQEEVFGPVLAVLRAKDMDEAIEIFNGTQYGLTGGIFSRSPRNLERAARELMVGNVYLNRGITGALVGRQPFGGFKMSGIGSKAGSVDYLLQFLLPRTITENTMRRGFAPLDESDGR